MGGRAQPISSEAFAREMIAALRGTPSKPEAGSEAEISPEELDDWLALFGGGKGNKE